MNDRRLVALALVVAALANLPLLLLDGLFWDDWTWLWTWHKGGAGAVSLAMWQLAHPGFAPVFELFFALGGDSPGPLARFVAVALHLGNGVLLWRVLDRGVMRAIAAPAAAFFLVSPWFTARGSLAHAQYDVFLACALASILLSRREGWVARVAALVLQLASLSLETLAALEILRVAHLRRGDEDWREPVRRALPYLVLAGVVALLRLTVLVPQGPWANYNAISLAPDAWLPPLAMHVRYLLRALHDAARQAHHFAGTRLLAATLIAFAAVAALIARRGRPHRRVVPWTAVLLAGAVGFAGALPYALAGHYPWVAHFGSRFAFVSQIGAAIGLAAALSLLPGSAVRAAARAVLVGLFGLAVAQNGKALLYDEAIQDSLRRALAEEVDDGPPRTLLVRLSPPSRRVLFRGRCLGANDLNVARFLAGEDSFVYDADCVNPGEGPRATPPSCTVAGIDYVPCPAPLDTATFVLDRADNDVRKFGMLELALGAKVGGKLLGVDD